MQVALVSREVYPFGGGGLGVYVSAAAEVLSQVADVTILTTDLYEEEYDALRAAGSPELPPENVRFAFIREPVPDDIPGYGHAMHCWGARVLETVKRLYPAGGPDILEVPDYLGEGCVLAQARRTCDPALRNTVLAVRIHTTVELAMVLNGYVPRDTETRILFDLERYALRNSDVVIWPGGEVHGTYQRFYGERGLAPSRRIRHPVSGRVAHATRIGAGQPSDGGPLRLLFAGRLERRKGVHNLVEAVCGLVDAPIELTLVGTDTLSAPLGQSMRQVLESRVAGDPRVVFKDGVDRDALLRLMAAHDVGVFPSLWECWGYVALETLAMNRPVVATPRGGFSEIVEPNRSGWLAGNTDSRSLRRLFEALLDERSEVSRVVAEQLPRQRFDELTAPEPIIEGYADVHAKSKRRQSRRRELATPLVSAVVPYFRLHEYVEETVASLAAQTYAPLEVIVVNDGSFEPTDDVLDRLAQEYQLRVYSQANAGLPAARNLGISLARGTYVFLLDADNVALPTFVERAVAVLEAEPDFAYVTSWLKFINASGKPCRDGWGAAGGYPLGNEVAGVEMMNTAGDAAALVRRSVFDTDLEYSPTMTAYEDWLLYRQLAETGWYGHVIPEELLLYRIRDESMLRQVGHQHHERLLGEMEAMRREVLITGSGAGR